MVILIHGHHRIGGNREDPREHRVGRVAILLEALLLGKPGAYRVLPPEREHDRPESRRECRDPEPGSGAPTAKEILQREDERNEQDAQRNAERDLDRANSKSRHAGETKKAVAGVLYDLVSSPSFSAN
jgi:hypothetical protein